MKSEAKGLTSAEATGLLKKFGPNALPETPPPTSLSILIAQIRNPLVYVLVAAGLVTFFLREVADTTIIVVAILTNGILGFFQERKASRALHALKKLIHPTAKVVRNSVVETIDAEEVVPGDVAILSQGEKVPADGEIAEANRLFIDEAILTGESVPVSKKKGDKVFMGTIISSGQGKIVVKFTGEET